MNLNEINIFSEGGEEFVDELDFGFRNGILYQDTDSNTATDIFELYGLPNGSNIPSELPQEESFGSVFMACSPLRTDNTHLLFIHNFNKIYRFIINQNGIIYDGEIEISSFLDTDDAIYLSVTPGEMELLLLDNGNYRIALPTLIFDGVANLGRFAVYLAELNSSGGLLPNSANYFYNTNAYINNFFTGLEFSPDGNILYMTEHDYSNTLNENIKYYNIENDELTAFTIPNITDYEFSQIEMGFDDKMYFVSENNFSLLEDPNNPSVLNWNTGFPINNSPTNVPMYYGSTNFFDVYLLPDQIDGMDYSSINSPETCCLDLFTYDTESYTSTTDNWTGTDNTINNGSSEVTIQTELRIPAGTNLDIHDMILRFAPDARLVIEPRNGNTPGGRLRLWNTTLTVIDDCGEQLWWGVEVEGHNNMSQSNNNQGRLEMRDNSVIEYARTGVRLYKNGTINVYDPIWSGTGGIVKAYNSTFRNNAKDVEYLYYHNTTNGVTSPNVGFFSRSNFIVNERIRNNSDNLDSRVSMYFVDKVKFNACNFSIEGQALNEYSPTQRYRGITSLNSSFRVYGSCSSLDPLDDCDEADITAEWIGTNASEITPCTFTNFTVGIRATGNGIGSSASIKQSLFTNNVNGIELVGLKIPEVFKCRFEVPQGFFLNSGLNMTSCTGYTVERNYFEGLNNGGLSGNVGVWILNSGPYENEIYLNDFHNLYMGTGVQGVNSALNTRIPGLEILCGLYDQTKFDIALTNETDIRKLQGSMTIPARNIFDVNDFGFDNNYYISFNSLNVNYFSHNEDLNPLINVEPDFFDPNDFNVIVNESLIFSNRLSKCPTHPKKPKSLAESKVIEKREIIDELEFDLETLVDGGNSINMLNMVTGSSYTSEEIRAVLLNSSPYITEEVLIASITRYEPLNQWHLCEILLANSPLSMEVYEVYEEAAPLAEFLDILLSQYQDGSNSYSAAKDEISSESSKKSLALKGYVQAVYKDDNEIDYDGIKSIVEGESQKEEIQVKAEIARRQGDLEEVANLLSIYEEGDNDVWKQYMLLESQMNPANRYADATPEQIEELEYLASTGKEGSINAHVVLEIITGIPYHAELFAPDENKSFQIPEKKKTKKKPALATVYPNPAQGDFYIIYVLPTERNQSSVDIYNMEGKFIRSEDISNGYGILQLNATDFEKGMYIFNLILEGEIVATDKFTVLE